MDVDVLVEDPRWATLNIDALSDRAVLSLCQQLDLTAVAVVVLACDDARIAGLNADFREKASATNVLSWPAEELAADTPGGTPHPPTPDPDGTLELGDIAISYDTCQREAVQAGVDMADHVTHLIVHGVLHLLGYDHIRDQDATLMEGLEVQILGKMGINDPYRIDSAQ